MPTTLNINEAKTNFSNVISNVETNLVTVTILRYGHPVARITPIKPRKRTLRRKDSRLAFQISDEDLYSDDAALWDACHA